MSTSHDSVSPTVAVALAPSLETKNTSQTAKTLSMHISSTIGMARRRMARDTAPSVKSRCEPRSASRMDDQKSSFAGTGDGDGVVAGADIDVLTNTSWVGARWRGRRNAWNERNQKGGTDRGAALVTARALDARSVPVNAGDDGRRDGRHAGVDEANGRFRGDGDLHGLTSEQRLCCTA